MLMSIRSAPALATMCVMMFITIRHETLISLPELFLRQIFTFSTTLGTGRCDVGKGDP